VGGFRVKDEYLSLLGSSRWRNPARTRVRVWNKSEVGDEVIELNIWKNRAMPFRELRIS
jgi:hypothetical protein